MALYGAVGEGWTYSGAGGTPGPRYNDIQFRGSVTVNGNATVTLPLPIRFAGFPQVTIAVAVAPGLDPILATVGSISGNTFKIFLWKATSISNPTLVASTTATLVYWQAFGSVTDNFVTGGY